MQLNIVEIHFKNILNIVLIDHDPHQDFPPLLVFVLLLPLRRRPLVITLDPTSPKAAELSEIKVRSSWEMQPHK